MSVLSSLLNNNRWPTSCHDAEVEDDLMALNSLAAFSVFFEIQGGSHSAKYSQAAVCRFTFIRYFASTDLLESSEYWQAWMALVRVTCRFDSLVSV